MELATFISGISCSIVLNFTFYFPYIVEDLRSQPFGLSGRTNDFVFGTCSQRKSRSQRQKHAALQRTAKKLGTKMNSTSPTGRGNRRTN